MRQSEESSVGRRNNIGGWIGNNWRSLTVLSAIILIALILRMFFAYGTSAGSGFALSGGSDAAYHLHVIEQILNGKFMTVDPALNYPFGGTNYSPPLFDLLVAIFAFPLKLFGFTTFEAASIALVYSTAVVGALTCIPVYLLGKEMFNRKAGYVAAAFFAISAIAIVRTVFSNGTESAFFVFFFLWMTLFLFRAIKAYKAPANKEEEASGLAAFFGNKDVFKNTLFAMLFLTAMILSWMGFISVIMILSAMMAVQAVIDRLRGESAIGLVKIYVMVMLPALLIAALYFGVLAGMTTFILGPLLLAILATLVSVFISTYRVWVISIPVSLIIVIAVFLLTAAFMPELHNAMTSVVHPYAEGKFGSLLGTFATVPLSSQAIYAGVVTMWFSFIVAAYLILRTPKKANSPSHLFITMWFVALLYASWKSMDLAYLAAPMYAIGTGVVIIWLLRRTDIKGYVETFKGTNVKTFWRKLIKPIPFLTVLGVVFILLMPNILFAVDAGIPGNKKADMDAQIDNTLGGFMGGSASMNYLGATNFYIRDSEWTLTTAWDHFGKTSNADKPALVTWLDYGAEAVSRGKFNIVADHFGNGIETASNVLTGDSSDAIIAMSIRLIAGNRVLVDFAAEEAIETTAWEPVAEELKQILFEGKVTVAAGVTTTNTSFVRSNPQIFGPTDFNIANVNATYMVAANYLKSVLTEGEIVAFYKAICTETGYEIGYVGVTGSMLPVYYGDNNLFSTMAFLNDYRLDANGVPTKYYTAGIPWTGYYYTYKAAMYDTMIWRALVGPSLEEYRAIMNDPSISQNVIINGLMLSDGTFKAYPGYGLTNFSVDLDNEWWVMYSPSKEAPYENWTVMNGPAAQALQASEGGTINYLGGMSFLKFDGSGVLNPGSVVTPMIDPATGTLDPVGGVNMPVTGLTVALYDTSAGERVLVGKTMTNADGKFSFFVPGDIWTDYEVVLYSGAVGTMEVIWNPLGTDQMEIEMAALEGQLVDMLVTDLFEDVIIELTGRYSGEEYFFSPDSTGAFAWLVVPDTYSVRMTINGAEIYTGTFTLYSGEMNVGDISVKEVSAEVTVKDVLGAPVAGAVVDVISTVYDPVSMTFPTVSATTDHNGLAKTQLAPGTYTVQLNGYDYNGATNMLLSSSSTTITTAFTAKLGSVSRVSVIMVPAVEVIVDNLTTGDEVTIMNGAYTPRGTYVDYAVAASPVTFYVPIGDYQDATSYTVSVRDANGIRYYPVPTGNPATVDADPLLFTTPMGALTITMKYDAAGTVSDKAGVVSFIDASGDRFVVAISVPKDGDPPFSVDLPNGKYTVYAYTYLPEKMAFIGTVEVGVDTELNIMLTDAIGISGDVRYTANTTIRVANVPVIIKATVGDTKYNFATATDAVGAYYVLVPKGNVYYGNVETQFGNFVRAASDVELALATQTTDRTSRNITVNINNSSSAATTIDVTTPSVTFSVSGNVKDTDGQGLAAASITYTLDGGFERKATTSGATTGAFSITRVSAGTVLTITGVELKGYTLQSDLSQLTYTLAGAKTGLEIIMEKDGVSAPLFISGTVKDIYGTARGPAVLEYTVNGGATETCDVASNGTFRIGGLASGDIVDITGFDTLPTGYTLYLLPTLPAAGINGTITGVEVFVESGSATQFFISGNVEDTGGNPIAGLAINYTVNGSAQSITSLPDGSFKTRAIASGANVVITGVANGYALTGVSPTDTFTVTADVTGVTITADVNAAERATVIPLSDNSSGTAIGDIDITIGTASAPADGKVTVTFVIRNNTLASAAIIISSTTTAKFGSTSTTINQNDFVLSVGSGAQNTVYVQYDETDPTPNVTITATSALAIVDLVWPPGAVPPYDTASHDIVVRQGGSSSSPIVKEFAPGQYLLSPGSINVKVSPTARTAGTEGYYYNGNLALVAGQTTLDLSELLVPITIVTFEVTSAADKVTMTSKGAVLVEKLDTEPEGLKIYYVPDADLMDCVLILENDTYIAYINIYDFSTASPAYEVVVGPYMGHKVSITGYVGRIADGEMTIVMTAGAQNGTCVVPISRGEYSATLPKDMDGTAIVYAFEAAVTDTVNGIGRDFTAQRLLPDLAVSPKTVLNDGDVINMEVVMQDPPVAKQSSTPGNITVFGIILDDTDTPMSGVKVTFEVDGRTDSVTTNSFGRYTISAPGTQITLTGVTKLGYVVDQDVSLIPPFVADGPQDFTMSYDVTITQTAATFTPEGNMVKAVITMDVTNDRTSTIVISAGRGWSLASFGTTNYVVIQAGATETVTLTAYYDPTRVGAGSDDLSVIVKNLLGNVLQSKTLDTSGIGTGSVEPPDTDLKITTEGNRVSKNEYGFAITFTALTDKEVVIDLTIDNFAAFIPAGWYVSIVDVNNVIQPVDATGAMIDTVTVDGNSSVKYYLRLILVDDWKSATHTLPSTIELTVTDSLAASATVDLNLSTTDLAVEELTATGNNIYGSLNGTPTIVWVMLALSVLMVLLILWLGIRRGVFTRKR